jgi:hypothetical protein
MRKVVIIPKGIDLEVLFQNNGVRQERSKKRLKDKIYYFLSRVITHEGNITLHLENGGFRPIPMKKIDKIFGTRDSRYVRKILTNPNDPIIESTKSYHVGKQPKGYKLTDKYRTGLIEFKTLGEDISSKLKDSEMIDLSLPDYGFLKDQFKENKLGFSEDFKEYLYQIGNSLLKVSKSQYHQNLIFNHIGRLIVFKIKIDNEIYHLSHSNKNHRFHSVLTMLPKSSRRFLQVNGQQLMEVDLGSSQPYLLAVLLKDLDNLITIKDSSSNSNCNTEPYSSIINKPYYINNKFFSSLLPLLLRTFEEIPMEIRGSIRDFYEIPFHQDFYSHIRKETHDKLSRDDVKNMFMYFLFDDNKVHRYHNDVIRVMGELYPGVNQFIGTIHSEYGKSDFARFLQFFESHLLIDRVVRELNYMYPHIPLFTVHDSILTTSEFVQLIKVHLEERLFELTSIYPLVKITSPVPLKTILEEDLNAVWKSIKPVTTKQKYLKKSNSIFSSNLLCGKEFLEQKPSSLTFLKGLDNFS